MLCRNCGNRLASHWAWFDPRRTLRTHLTVPTCSRTCMEVWKGRRAVVDPNEHELAAMIEAGARAGEFIDRLGRTDMADWSETEWQSFIGVVCGGYVDALMSRQAEVTAAMSRVRAP